MIINQYFIFMVKVMPNPIIFASLQQEFRFIKDNIKSALE